MEAVLLLSSSSSSRVAVVVVVEVMLVIFVDTENLAILLQLVFNDIPRLFKTPSSPSPGLLEN